MSFTFASHPLSTWRRGLALLAALGAGPIPLHADEHLSEAQSCAFHESRLERLECYDALFMAGEEGATNDNDSFPALWRAVQAQERSRDPGDMGLMVREQEDGVRLSVPALGSVPPRPVLVIACESEITHFQLHLPQAVNASRIDLRLRMAGKSLEQEWRIRDDGHVVGGGRGLPAIGTLRQLLRIDELTLESRLAELDGLRFDLTDLHRHIRPLRDACRW